MIKFDQVTKKYGETTAVNNLSIEIETSQVCVIIGPSGCGKSTSLRMINRLVDPTSGKIFINGENVHDFKPELLRRSIGYVIQSIGLFPHMTVGENIAVTPKLLLWDKAKINSRINLLLELVNLHPDTYRNKYPHELSGGEAQRIGVARALAADPPVLLMDEPFGAVDPLNRENLQREFAKIQKELKKTVVFITHDIDEAIRLADKIAIMKNGSILQYDTPENILINPHDKFVHDFIGADRALKRLSRFYVSDYIKPVTAIKVSADKDVVKKLLQSQSYLWVTDDKGLFLGWLNSKQLDSTLDIKNAVTTVNPADVAVKMDTTLREALSKMFGQGIKSAAVVDADFKLVGEVSFADIENTVSSL